MRRPLPGIAAIAGALLLLVAAAAGAVADPVSKVRGDPAAHAAEGDRVFRFLALAKTEAEGRAMEDQAWLWFMAAPDAASAGLMNRALERRGAFDLDAALAVLDELVAAAPDWAEAWNQRATVRFEKGDFEGSLADIEVTLRLEPRHFGALAGRAIIETGFGRVALAQSDLRRAVAIHPFLKERGLLIATPGKDI